VRSGDASAGSSSLTRHKGDNHGVMVREAGPDISLDGKPAARQNRHQYCCERLECPHRLRPGVHTSPFFKLVQAFLLQLEQTNKQKIAAPTVFFQSAPAFSWPRLRTLGGTNIGTLHSFIFLSHGRIDVKLGAKALTWVVVIETVNKAHFCQKKVLCGH